MTRVLCFTIRVPKRFWAKVIMIAAFVINRMPAIVHYQTLLRKLYFFITSSFALNICLIVFGCVCCVHIYALHRDKFDPCALKCVFWDTPTHKKGINVFVHVLINILCPWMFNFVNMSLISLMSF